MRNEIKSKLACLAIALGFILALSGCNEKGPASETVVNDDSLFDKLPDKLSIDDSMEVPEIHTLPTVYQVALAAPTQENIKNFLTEVADSTPKIEISDYDDSQQISANTAKGVFMMNRSFSQRYTGCSFYYDTGNDDWYKSEYVLNYYGRNGEDNVQRIGNEVFFHNANRYKERKDFAFASAKSAEETVRRALAMLDVHDLILSQILFLDHATMAQVESETNAAAQEALANGEEVFPKGPDGAYLTGKLKKQWTEMDDCYMFIFTGGVDGIPMVRSEKMDNTTFFVPTTVIVRYNASGITYIDAVNPWNVTEQLQQAEAILSAEQALQKGIEIVQNILVKENQVITRLSLRYYVVQDNKRWLLMPVWEITVCRKDVIEYYPTPKDLYYYILVDAITGKEL